MLESQNIIGIYIWHPSSSVVNVYIFGSFFAMSLNLKSVYIIMSNLLHVYYVMD